MRYIVIVLTLSGWLTPFASAGKFYRPMDLNPALTTELNDVLSAVNDMHSAFFEQNEEQIKATLQKVLSSIDRAKVKSGLAEDHKPHLVKMLEATRAELQVAKNSEGEQRKDSLKNALKQIVQLAQTYKLDKYKVYFCPKDRAVWLQKSWGPKNPVHPKKHGDCGKIVR